MAKTVDDLRNEIRVRVGRYERVESTAFTKEALAAICEAVDADVETDPIPAKSVMRAGILRAIGRADGDLGPVERSFRKAELEAIASVLQDDE